MRRAGNESGDGDAEYSTSNFELFFDLVFVFAVTQVSHILIDDLSWAGALHSVIAFLVVWWAWQFTVWMTNELDPDAIPVRLLLIFLMLGSLFLAVAIPGAFGDRGLLFACAYVFIQVARQAYLTFVPTEEGTAERKRSAHTLVWFLVSGCFWILGGIVEGEARVALWLVALAIDYGIPRLSFRLPFAKPLSIEAWEIGSAHFTERFQGFTIIALGESVVLTGATAAGLGLDLPVVVGMLTSFVATVALWWLYFNSVATVFAHLLERAGVRSAVARDLFTYGHIPIVAGIILCAVGDDLVIHSGERAVGVATGVVLAAGPVLYLAAYIPARLQVDGSLPRWRVGGAAVCALIGVAAILAKLSVLALGILLTLVLVGVVIGEFRLPLTVLKHHRRSQGA